MCDIVLNMDDSQPVAIATVSDDSASIDRETNASRCTLSEAILTLALIPISVVLDIFRYVDLFTIPTHYLVDDDESFRTFHPSRLMGLFDMLNADSLVDLVTGLGAGKRKILISLPASAYKFSLVKSEDNAPRSSTKEKQPVRIDRSEMCRALDEGEWIVERDEDLTAPYTFRDDTWIAFEDRISAGIKVRYRLYFSGCISAPIWTWNGVASFFIFLFALGKIRATPGSRWSGNPQR